MCDYHFSLTHRTRHESFSEVWAWQEYQGYSVIHDDTFVRTFAEDYLLLVKRNQDLNHSVRVAPGMVDAQRSTFEISISSGGEGISEMIS